MRIEELAKKHAHSMPGYELVKYSEDACPIYKIDLNITMQKKKKIGIVQEFCLKFLDCGIENIEEVSKFLGLDKNIIYDSIVELNRLDLVKTYSEKDVSITSKGKEVLRELNLLVPEEINLPIYVDALTNNIFMSNAKFLNSKDIKRSHMHTLKSANSRVTMEDINEKEVSRVIKKYRKKYLNDDKYDGILLSVNHINKAYFEYKKLNILTFYNKEREELDIKVFEKSDRVPEYEEIILKMQNNNVKQIDFDRKIQYDNVDIEEKDYFTVKLSENIINKAWEYEKNKQNITQKIDKIEREIKENKEILSEELSDLEEKCTATQMVRILKEEVNVLKSQLDSKNKIVHTYEHRELLINSLKRASKFVVIVSPWIKRSGFDTELENLIKQTIGRNVKVFIGYGISEKDNSDKEIIKKLNKIQEKNNKLKVIKLANTHEKVLICDNEFVVVTSFNWLSFKGNPDFGFRQETGIYTENKEIISNMILSLEQRMNVSIC
ncbi:phospholipase D-like domain-containing protein [Clostridium baratii]|uniref:phospholipase D-like domain-containing protein n=1 Tax=Clostridium baratii TaxID=1561 RepID=UPI002A753FA7|nr:phospholipase D-like domain-containing protein [Clostridium baratii]MDY3208422.1 phospholipase D-like domain-containing protein [Clostridium baratii]